MDLKNPDSMNAVIGNVLRAGVILSAAIIFLGVGLLLVNQGSASTTGALTYLPNQVPHGTFPVGVSDLMTGLIGFQAYSIIELGVLVLLSTPVTRVFISIFLFALERDRTYVYITAIVFAVLLFSIFATPLIPGFNA